MSALTFLIQLGFLFSLLQEIKGTPSYTYIPDTRVEVAQLDFPTMSGLISKSSSYTFTKTYSTAPKILIAQQRMKLGLYYMPYFGFTTSIDTLTSTSFTFTLSQIDLAQGIENMRFSFLIIDNPNAYVFRETLSSTITSSINPTNSLIIQKQFIRALLPGETRTISAYLIDLVDTKPADGSGDMGFNFEMKVTILNDLQFQLEFIIDDFAYSVGIQYISSLTYNYIEFYAQGNEILDSNFDLTFETNVGLLSNSPNSVTSTLPVKSTSTESIFIGLQKYSIFVGNYFGSIFISLSMASPNALTIRYESEFSDSNMITITSQVLIFSEIKCDDSTLFYDPSRDICVSECQQEGYFKYVDFKARSLCKPCDSTCFTCSGSLSSQCICAKTSYMYNSKCYSEKPSGTYCDSTNHCFDCQYPCSECTNNATTCSACATSFSLDSNNNNNTCICSDTSMYYIPEIQQCVYRDSLMSQEQIQQTAAALTSTSDSSLYLSLAFMISSGFIKSGQSFVSQILAIQKIYYLLLINVYPPQFLQEFINALSSKGVLKKFQKTNIFVSSEPNSQLIGNKYTVEKIQSNIQFNAGGAITMFFIMTPIYAIFYFLSKKQQLSRYVVLIFEKALSGTFTQNFQLAILVCTYSSSIFTSVINSDTESASSRFYDNFSFLLSIAYIIGAYTAIVILLYYHGKEPQLISASVPATLPAPGSSKPKEQVPANQIELQDQEKNEQPQVTATQSPPPIAVTASIKGVVIEKLANNCRRSETLPRLYMPISLGIECILFPIASVMFRGNAEVATLTFCFLQLGAFLCAVIIRPFKESRENFFLICESAIFLLSFILFFMLTLLLKGVGSQETAYSDSINLISLIIMIILIGIVLLNPISQVVAIIVLIKNIIAKKKQEKAESNNNKVTPFEQKPQTNEKEAVKKQSLEMSGTKLQATFDMSLQHHEPDSRLDPEQEPIQIISPFSSTSSMKVRKIK